LPEQLTRRLTRILPIREEIRGVPRLEQTPEP